MAANDPFQPHLTRAAALFQAGDAVQAGQIWQAILKRDPANQAARAGLYQVKLFLDHRDGEAEPERLLREGCTLYDMGQVQDALQKWERVLALAPDNRLALAYANDARRDLGIPALPAPAAPQGADPGGPPAKADAGPAAPPAGNDATPDRADQLVREAIQLFDMGMTEEAIDKWERALQIQPDHRDAPEYLKVARRELAERAPAPAVPPRPAADPAPAASVRSTGGSVDPLASRIVRAEQLLRAQRLEEAVQAFQRLLAMDPHEPRILQGYHHARALLTARNEPPLPARQAQVLLPALAPVELDRAPAPQTGLPAPVGPPQSVIASRPPQREGFRLPAMLQGGAARIPLRLRQLTLPQAVRRPRNLAIGLGALLLLAVTLGLYAVHRQEVALREAVAVAKLDALRPVSRLVVIPALDEAPDAIHHEAERALDDDPLRAYYRAGECLRLDPDNAAAAQLKAQAKARLGAGQPLAWTPADVDRNVAAGDLETARKCVLALLAQSPDDAELKELARKVELALAPLYAGRDRLDDARNVLLLGRAMFPQERIWQARLKLLEAIEAMPASERAPWLHLLG